MSDIEKQIESLVTSSGKSAIDMSKPLKIIGKGSMEDGIKRLAVYYKTKGGLTWGPVGLAGGLTIAGIVFLIVKFFKEKKALNEEEKALLNELEEGLSKSEEDTDDGVEDGGDVDNNEGDE